MGKFTNYNINKNMKTENYKKKIIIVIGDVMLDNDIYCTQTKLSQNMTNPILRIKKIKNKLGGAANTAKIISELKVSTMLLGFIGNDTYGTIIKKILKKNKIKYFLKKTKIKKTIKKTRIINNKQQILRIDTESNFYKLKIKNIEKKIKENLNKIKCIIFSDYNKGTIKEQQNIILKIKKKNIPILVDSKIKEFFKYKNIKLLKPNIHEFKKIVGTCNKKKCMYIKGKNLIKSLNIKYLLLTMNSNGMSLISSKIKKFLKPKINKNEVVKNIIGAGDSTIATISTLMSQKIKIEKIINIANIITGMYITKKKISFNNIKTTINNKKEKYKKKIKNIQKIFSNIKNYKKNKKKIVFTNGCFDIIHHGHIIYLEKSKKLGDKLIVGINSDKSIINIKGKSRPLNKLKYRIKVLSSIKYVDLIIPFNEKTPGNLIKKINPDILIKTNENYKNIKDMPENEGVKFVLKNKGKVFLFTRTKQISSTKIIKNKLKKNHFIKDFL